MSATLESENFRGGDRRRRLRRPASLTTFGALFVGLPLSNYASIAYRLGLPLSHPGTIFANLNPLEIILLAGAVPVGAGLLMVKKWGWWSFLAYSCCTHCLQRLRVPYETLR